MANIFDALAIAWYATPAAPSSIPDLVVCRYAGSDVIIVLETPREKRRLDDALAALQRGDDRLKVDASNLEPSRLPPLSHPFILTIYDPPAAGWPYLVLLVHQRAHPGKSLLRDRYGVNKFATQTEAVNAIADMVAAIDQATKCQTC